MSDIIPPCPVYGECGGCQYQHLDYQAELQEKERLIREVLALPADLFVPIIPSPKEYQYRHRVDLRMHRHPEKGIVIGFCPPGRRRVLEITQCPIARGEISNFIPQLKEEAIAKFPQKYKVANLVVRCGEEGKVYWGGIGEGSLKMKEADYLWAQVGDKRIHYAMESFFQGNLSILPAVMKELRALNVWTKRGVFFDLYGGVGLFGLCMADLVDKVIHIEENQVASGIARYNALYNKVYNFEVYGGQVESVIPRLIHGYQDQHKIVMVDPPRAGLSRPSIDLLNSLTSVDHLFYLSCHPNSLKEDLGSLSAHWQVERIIPFDFFPKTKHVETFVLLKRV